MSGVAVGNLVGRRPEQEEINKSITIPMRATTTIYTDTKIAKSNVEWDEGAITYATRTSSPNPGSPRKAKPSRKKTAGDRIIVSHGKTIILNTRGTLEVCVNAADLKDEYGIYSAVETVIRYDDATARATETAEATGLNHEIKARLDFLESDAVDSVPETNEEEDGLFPAAEVKTSKASIRATRELLNSLPANLLAPLGGKDIIPTGFGGITFSVSNRGKTASISVGDNWAEIAIFSMNGFFEKSGDLPLTGGGGNDSHQIIKAYLIKIYED